jgi:hypothetical protein
MLTVDDAEESRGVMIGRERVKQAGACKESVVPGGEDACDDDGVDEGSCDLGTGHLEHNCEGRCVTVLGGQAGVVVWDIEADD